MSDTEKISDILEEVFPSKRKRETVAEEESRREKEEIEKGEVRKREKKIKILDETDFTPLADKGGMVSQYAVPTAKEVATHPELGYTNKQLQDLVKKMTPDERREFREYEEHFLKRFRLTGNIVPLHLEVRAIVRNMCPGIPSSMQNEIADLRSELMDEQRLRDLCKKMGLPMPELPQRPAPPMTHPVDESILGTSAALITPVEKLAGPSTSQKETITEGGKRRIIPVQVPATVKTEIDVKPIPVLATTRLTQGILDSMIEEDNEDCTITRIKRGKEPLYDLTGEDMELEMAINEIPEEVIPPSEGDEDNLSVATMDSLIYIDHKEAKKLLQRIAHHKAEEAKAFQELAVMTDDLSRGELYDTVQSCAKMNSKMPELDLIEDEYDYETTKLILAAGYRMKQALEKSTGIRDKVEALQRIAVKFGVSKSRLYELVKGQPIGRGAESMKTPKLYLEGEGEQEEEKVVTASDVNVESEKPVTHEGVLGNVDSQDIEEQ